LPPWKRHAMIDNANALAGILHNRPLPARVRAEVLRSRLVAALGYELSSEPVELGRVIGS
jgi:hypothetical protein